MANVIKRFSSAAGRLLRGGNKRRPTIKRASKNTGRSGGRRRR